MLRDFVSWWTGQLIECVPAGWRGTGSSSDDGLVIAPLGTIRDSVEAIAVSLRRNGRETSLGRYDMRSGIPHDWPVDAGTPAVLRLADADVLGKTVTLPLATERDLGHVLALEMDHETPFSTEEIFWTYRVVSRDRQRNQLSVRLLLVPRQDLAGLLGTLADAGIAPDRAEVTGGLDQGWHVPLHSDERSMGRRSGPRWARRAAAAVCIGLAAAVTVTPFVRQNSALAELDQETAEGRAAADDAIRLRQEVERLSNAREVIESERDRAGRPLATLAEVTRVLPDDTYLTELRQQQQKLTVSGRSAGASRLIGAIAAGNRLRNPTFSAPVTRIETAHLELFTITAEIGP